MWNERIEVNFEMKNDDSFPTYEFPVGFSGQPFRNYTISTFYSKQIMFIFNS